MITYQIYYSGLQTSLNKIKVNHGKTLQFQAMLRAFEAKDRNVIEHNYERVNFWSMVHLLAMVATAIFQVFIISALNDNCRFSAKK